jgi:hypothetical protein
MASGSMAATITRFFSPLSKEEVHEKIKKIRQPGRRRRETE